MKIPISVLVLTPADGRVADPDDAAYCGRWPTYENRFMRIDVPPR